MMKKITYILVFSFLFVIGLQAQDAIPQIKEDRDTTSIRDAITFMPNLYINIGLGLGGSNIAGVDVEYRFLRFYPIRNVSVQAGLGYTGFDAGVNYRLGEFAKVGTLTLGLQYRYTGFGNDDTWGYSTSNIGPVVIFRGGRWFVAQIGAGYILNKGEAYSGSEDRKIQIHGGVGIYLAKYLK
jgi:opacity protein-like surface antigen